METIFDFLPTTEELEAIGIDSVTLANRHGVNLVDPIDQDSYSVSQADAFFDIALLFEHRNEPDKAAEYWEEIPDRHQEYLLGFDFAEITE